MLPVLKPVSKCWQPYDMLPKPEDPDFVDQVTFKIQIMNRKTVAI